MDTYSRVEEIVPKRPSRFAEKKKKKALSHHKRLKPKSAQKKHADHKTWVKGEIERRRKLCDKLEVELSLSFDASTPKTLLSLIQFHWLSKQKNSKTNSKTAAAFILPNMKELYGEFNASWELMFTTMKELEISLSRLIPKFNDGNCSWLIDVPKFIPPKLLEIPNLDQNHLNIQLPDFIPPPPKNFHSSQKQYYEKLAAGVEYLKIPHLAVKIPLPELENIEKKCETVKEGIKCKVQSQVMEMHETHLDELSRWRNCVCTMDWNLFNYSELIQNSEKEENVRIPQFKPPAMESIPAFVEPSQKFRNERRDIENLPFDIFRPELERVPQDDVSLSKLQVKKRELEFLYDRWLQRGLVKQNENIGHMNEIEQNISFKQIPRLRIQGCSHWKRTEGSFGVNCGYMVICKSTKCAIEFAYDMGSEPIVQVGHSSEEEIGKSVSISISNVTSTGFHLSIELDEKIQVFLLKWRALGQNWFSSGVVQRKSEGLYKWNTGMGLAKIEKTASMCNWAFVDYPALHEKLDLDIVTKELFNKVNGDMLIEKASLTTMRKYSPPINKTQENLSIFKAHTLQGYRVVLVIDATQHMRKSNRWDRLKAMLLHFLDPAHGGIRRVCENGGKINISILRSGMVVNRFENSGLVAIDEADMLYRMQKWVADLKAPTMNARVESSKLLETELRWASTQRVHALHFLTADLGTLSISKNFIPHYPPLHIITFGIEPSSKRHIAATIMRMGGTIEELDDLRIENTEGAENYNAVFAPNGDDLEMLLCTNEAPIKKCAAQATQTDQELQERQLLYDEEYKKEEALIREQNRAKLSHVKDSYYRKAKEALESYNEAWEQDRIHCILWRWHQTAEFLNRRYKVTFLNLFLAAATIRGRTKKQKKQNEFRERRKEAVSCVSHALTVILQNAMLEIYSTSTKRHEKEKERIKTRNENRLKEAKLLHAEEIKSRLETFDSASSRLKRKEFRDQMYSQYKDNIQRINQQNDKALEIAQEKYRKLIIEIKQNSIRPEIFQILKVIKRKEMMIEQLLTQCYFQAASTNKALILETPENLADLINFMPLKSHEMRRKRRQQELVLYSHCLEREYHTFLDTSQDLINRKIELRCNAILLEKQNMREELIKKNTLIQQEFDNKISQCMSDFIKEVEAVERFQGSRMTIVKGWKLAPQIFAKCESKERRNLFEKRKREVSMLRLLKAIDKFDSSEYKLDGLEANKYVNLEDASLENLFSKQDKFNKLLFSVFRLRHGNINPLTTKALQNSKELDLYDAAARQQARNKRKLISLKLECNLLAFHLAFENASRNLLQKWLKQRESIRSSQAYDLSVTQAREKWKKERENILKKVESQRRENMRRHQVLVRDLNAKNKEILQTAKADYQANIIDVIHEYNQSVQFIEQRAVAAKAELLLLQRFRHELELFKPKQNMTKKIPTEVLRRTLQMAFKPHIAGSGVDYAKSKRKKKV